MKDRKRVMKSFLCAIVSLGMMSQCLLPLYADETEEPVSTEETVQNNSEQVDEEADQSDPVSEETEEDVTEETDPNEVYEEDNIIEEEEEQVEEQTVSEEALNDDEETSGTCGDNLTWSFDSGSGKLTISGTGDMDDFSISEAPWESYTYHITSVSLPDGLTSIGNYAFWFCNLTSVVIPDGVTSIGYDAFSYCDELTSVTIPSSVTNIGSFAFYECKSMKKAYYDSLKSIFSITYDYCGHPFSYSEGNIYVNEKLVTDIVVPSTVTTIGDHVLDSCTGIKSITIPDTVTSIGDYALRDCTGLTSITIPNSVTSIGDSALRECTGLTSIKIPSSVTSIGANAFSGCEGLTSIKILGEISEIGDATFYKCSSLTSITLPDSVESIGIGAFKSCSDLESITIPESVTSIDDVAFYECSSLTSITIPKNVETIGYEAFSECPGLEKIKVDEDNQTFDSRDDCNAIILTFSYSTGYAFAQGNSLLFGCKNTVIPDDVWNISTGAFAGCTGLKSITIPDSVTSIGNYAFSGCTGLTSITIPDSVDTICGHAFDDCTNLESITIPDTCTDIGYYNRSYCSAFSGCDKLTIYGYTGSAAEEHANTYGINFESTGVHSVTFSDSSVHVKKGGTVQLDCSGPSDIRYKSSKKSIATVNSTTGVVTGVAPGTVTITAYSKSNKSNKATCKVTVAYKIAYNLNGGTNNASNPTWYTGTVTLKSPTKTGYTFKGWYTNSKLTNKVTSVTNKNVTLYAKWELAKYTVKFNANGGTGTMSSLSKTYSLTGETYTLPLNTFKRNGYAFTGWNSKAGGTGKISCTDGQAVTNLLSKAGTVTLYAQWTPITYNITYNLNGGTNNASNPSTYNIESDITLKAPTKTGYTFAGWSVGSKKTIYTTYNLKGKYNDRTLVAHWTPKSYTIKYNLNGGTNNSNNPTSYTIESSTITLQNPKMSGYAFVGWYTDKAMTNKITEITTGSHGTVTLYAKWAEKSVIKNNKINPFATNLTSNQYSALKNGTITAVKYSSTWYYQFSEGSTTLYVPVSCFYANYGNTANDYSEVNAQLSSVTNTADPCGAFNDMMPYPTYHKQVKSVNTEKAFPSTGDTYTYKMYLASYEVYAQLNSAQDSLWLQSKIIDEPLCFEYSELSSLMLNSSVKVLTDSGSTDADQMTLYNHALTRSSGTLGNMFEMTPEFDVEISNNEGGECHLSTVKYDGIGTKREIDAEDVITNFISVALDVSGAKAPYSTTYKIGKDIYKLAGALSDTTTQGYDYSWDQIVISPANDDGITKYVYGIKATSPVTVTSINDGFHADIGIVHSTSFSLTIKFSVQE